VSAWRQIFQLVGIVGVRQGDVHERRWVGLEEVAQGVGREVEIDLIGADDDPGEHRAQDGAELVGPEAGPAGGEIRGGGEQRLLRREVGGWVAQEVEEGGWVLRLRASEPRPATSSPSSGAGSPKDSTPPRAMVEFGG
jgi:hypothetical protein